MPADAPGEKLKARLAKLGLDDWKPQANPVVFWDIYGKLGHPVRATISEMGPTLLARVLELNDTQEGVLEVVFKVADDQGCCCWTWPTCARCSASQPRTPRRSPSSTA